MAGPQPRGVAAGATRYTARGMTLIEASRSSCRRRTAGLATLLVLIVPHVADAYVDPTGGGFLLQLLLGGGTAIVLLARVFLKRFAARIGRRFRGTK